MSRMTTPYPSTSTFIKPVKSANTKTPSIDDDDRLFFIRANNRIIKKYN